MIRRSPTRIELKLEDMQEVEFLQKPEKEKRKTVLAACAGIEEAKKLIRQERIGYQGSGTTSRPTGTSASRRISQPPGVTTVPPAQRTSAASQATMATATPPQAVENVTAGEGELVDMSIDSPAGN